MSPPTKPGPRQPSHPDLLGISETLTTVRDRVQAVADLLQGEGRNPGRARRAKTSALRQLLALAGDMIGIQELLLAVAEDLERRRQRRAAAAGPEAEEALDQAAELLATVQCVIRDNLDPAVEALAAACRRGE